MWQYNPQYNPQHKCSKRGGEGGVKGRLNNVKKTAQLAHVAFPKRSDLAPDGGVYCNIMS